MDLNKIKDTAETTNSSDKDEFFTIYPSDTAWDTAKKIFDRFKPGDFIKIEGTVGYEFNRWRECPVFPKFMELRIRMVDDMNWVIFYPKGLLTWWYLQGMAEKSPYKFKNKIDQEKGILQYKIWRSE